ncbi:GNAT family N-acetyltransferase [Comamonas sp. B-9]|uniref:GNAT family N-acetyltransferase n=1 Tax=Comamonas sp. B-9 TaxID=1055192 RepID=UPI0004272E05|nr:GNAT family N-acetyltransferase [Comamonas sp. B-9]
MASPLIFELDPVTDARVLAFLEAHLSDMRRISPPESVHALDPAQLRAPGLQLWTGWTAAQEPKALVATCALKILDAGHLELKSMRVEAAQRGSGAAQQVLDHVLAQARAMGARRISLETGTEAFFAPARRFYARNGFVDCAPFGSYQPDPNSCFMRLELP